MSIQEVVIENTYPNRADNFNPQHMNQIYVHIASRIRKRRNELGFSQEDVASMLGISPQQQCKYESPLNQISVPRLYAMACVLHVSFGYFCEGWEHSLTRDPSLSSEFDVSTMARENSIDGSEARNLFKYYSRIFDPNIRQCMRSLMKTFAASTRPHEPCLK